MSNCARCIHCCSTDVECVGTAQYGLDEYYCHDCEKYFEIDWDLQDELEDTEKNEMEEDYEEDEEEEY